MTRAEFAEGLMRVSVACQRALDDAVLKVYADALAHQATADEWDDFTRTVVASGKFRFFPTVAELIDALREHRGARPLEVEAGEAYERALSSGIYSPQGGTTWTYRGVLETCGRAAADAFLAAGGHGAFSTTWDESKRRERFLREYVSAGRGEPGARLLPAAQEQKALPSGEAEPSAAEAREILKGLAGRVQPEPRRASA